MLMVAELNPDSSAMADWCLLHGHLHRPFYGRYVHGPRPPQWAVIACMQIAMAEVYPGACVLWVQEPDLYEDPEPLEPGMDLRITKWGLHVLVSRETRDLFDRTWEDGPIAGGGPLPRLLHECERLGLNVASEIVEPVAVAAPSVRPRPAKRPPLPSQSTARRK